MEARIVLFERDGSVAALSLFMDERGGMIGFAAGRASATIRMMAKGIKAPVCLQGFPTRGEALERFTKQAIDSMRNGWTVIYHGQPNMG